MIQLTVKFEKHITWKKCISMGHLRNDEDFDRIRGRTNRAGLFSIYSSKIRITRRIMRYRNRPLHVIPQV